MALPLGTRLGPYEIISAIGAGGMGEVYRARDTRLDRTVAVKVLPFHLSESAEAKQRFEREARAISSLSHPNICHLYDVGSQRGTEYLVMEYLEGETLAERLRKGALPLEQVLKIGTEVSEALEAAHSQGILHRDLKPGNIMLTKSGAKLMDFGLAKSATAFANSMAVVAGPSTPSSPTLTIASLSSPAEPLTQKGAVLGTLQYIAPEVLQGKDTDARSDIFSFGCVLYEMITGQRAFPGKSQLTVMSAILERDPEPILALQPDTPPTLEYVVRTCLAKNPAERWQSAGDIARNFQMVRSVAPHTQTRAKTGWPQWLAYALAAAIVVVAVVLWWGMGRRKPEPLPSAALSRFSFPAATNYAFTDFAVSPDGRQIAFSDAGAIWVRPLDSQVPRKLSRTAGEGFNERLMFWSPDARSIAFLSGFKLRRVSVADGVVQDICEIRGFSPAGGTWGRNDILIGSYRGPIMKITTSGGQPVAMKLEKNEDGQRWPSFLPDGQHFLYLSASGSFLPTADNRQIRYADLAGNSRVVLGQNSNAEYAAGNLLYVKDSALVAAPFDTSSGEITGAPTVLEADVDFRTTFGRGYFDAGPDVLAYRAAPQPELLTWVDRDGREVARVGRGGSLTSFDVSADGKSAVEEISNERNGNGELWLMDLERQVPTRVTMDDSSWNWGPVLSAGGKTIYFSSTRSGISDLYERQVGGSEDRRILSGPDRLAALDVSHDGKYLLYEDLDPSSAADLWVLPLSGDKKPFAYIKTNYMESSARFSPDGRWVAYVSNESGDYEVYVQSFPTPGQEIRVSSQGGMDPRWRGDGRELYFVSAGQLMAADVKADRGLSIGIPKPMFRFNGSAQTTRRSYWPSPDGRRFLVMKKSDDSPAQINVTLNWLDALNK